MLVSCHQIQKLCSDPVRCKLTSAYVTCVVDESIDDVNGYYETTSEYVDAYDYNYYEDGVSDSQMLNLHDETETITLELNVFNEMENDSNKKKYLLEAKLFVYGKYC